MCDTSIKYSLDKVIETQVLEEKETPNMANTFYMGVVFIVVVLGYPP